MSLLDLNYLPDLSKTLELAGEPLQIFIREYNNLIRDERAAQREESKAAREFQLQQAELPPQ